MDLRCLGVRVFRAHGADMTNASRRRGDDDLATMGRPIVGPPGCDDYFWVVDCAAAVVACANFSILPRKPQAVSARNMGVA